MSTSTIATPKYWLLKAEPDSRIVKGKDVKFSVDDFETVKTSPWEGVRSYEARNLMKQMSLGDNALFYHSNCKTPGIAAFAEISKEAYADYTAWDPSHPYFDEKSKSDEPKWFMVDLTFKSRAAHFVPLALLRYIANFSGAEPPEEIAYIGETGMQSIKEMDLVRKGRLSVQRVTQGAWDAISLLAEKGGWDDMDLRPTKPGAKPRAQQAAGKSETNEVETDEAPSTKAKKAQPKRQAATKSRRPAQKRKGTEEEEAESSPLSELSDEDEPVRTKRSSKSSAPKRKRGEEDKVQGQSVDPTPVEGRRSSRRRKI